MRCMLLLHLLTAATASACTPGDPAACFGNGACTPSTHTCACNAGWTSTECDVLDLAAVDSRRLGYRNASNPVWGGTVVEYNGQHHLFMGGKRLNAGFVSSVRTRAVRAVSTTGPEGPYVFAEELTATPAARLGPAGIGLRVDVHRAPNGSLVLFTAAAVDRKFGLVALVSPAGDPAGPWFPNLLFRVHTNASARWDCGQIADPSASIAANGSLLVVFRTKYGCGGMPLERIGLLKAPHWTGPVSRVTTDATAPLFGLLVSNEDPYIWHSTRGVHMLLHTQGGIKGPWPDQYV